MKCKKCNNDFTPQKGLKSYCSLSCRNSRTWSEEDKKKKSISAKNSLKVKQANKEKAKNIDWDSISNKLSNLYKDKIMNEKFENLSFERLRKRVIYEQDEKCNNCGVSEWFGKKLSLELDHIDGDNSNNNRKNLEALCPNCHSITDTWRGRNKKNTGVKKVVDETLYKALIKNEWNMRQSLLEVGLAAKGGNYNRCHKLKRLHFDT